VWLTRSQDEKLGMRVIEEEKRKAKGPECSVKEDQEVDSADSMN
jgi:hypothetical protein